MKEKRPRSEAPATASLKRSAARGPESHVLVIRHGEQFRLEPVTGPEVVIGRDATSTIMIDDDSISRRHAKISFGSKITIEDLGSRNGTFVGGRRLVANEPTVVNLDEPLTVADVQIFVERAPRRSTKTQAPLDGVIVTDPKMRQLYAALEVVAASPLRIVILGATGVGKDVFARTIHAKSARAAKPFLALNCAAFAESLLEGELFGFEKGAFTGAANAKAGLFETADGGTVFLDEVGELSPAIQVKLLRVLESGEVMRLGSLTPKRIDVRVVSATNRDLRALVADGRFREDLYFRLNGTTMRIPSLRDRLDDIAPLARAFATAMAASQGQPVPTIEPGALSRLELYSWPGNVRELKNVIDRAVVMRRGASIRADDLQLEGEFLPTPAPAKARVAAPAAPAGDGLWNQLEDIERQRIVDALAASGGNQSAAAKSLGIARATLISRIEQYGLVRPKKGR